MIVLKVIALNNSFLDGVFVFFVVVVSGPWTGFSGVFISLSVVFARIFVC